MAMPEVSEDFLNRLVKVEDDVQRIKFVHMAKTDAQAGGLAILYAQQQRIQQELSGFRAEAAAEFGAMRTDLEAVKAEQARQGERLDQVQASLAEVLRRLPEQP